jgi:hypothetical protein
MLSKPMRLLAAATVLLVLAAPAPALAKGKPKKGHSPSAVDVYVEQVPTATGHAAPPPATGQTTESTPAVPLRPKARRQLHRRGGKDRGFLRRLATHPDFVGKLEPTGAVASPGTLGAAFDLGAGPTTLFALILATALACVLGGGLRGWRRRRSA